MDNHLKKNMNESKIYCKQSIDNIRNNAIMSITVESIYHSTMNNFQNAQMNTVNSNLDAKSFVRYQELASVWKHVYPKNKQKTTRVDVSGLNDQCFWLIISLNNVLALKNIETLLSPKTLFKCSISIDGLCSLLSSLLFLKNNVYIYYYWPQTFDTWTREQTQIGC